MNLAQRSAKLSTGTITVEIDRTMVEPDDLFDFAERHNPKRSFLFVSKVLGRHVPVSPRLMRTTFVKLAAQIPVDLPGPVLVVGLAETAVGLGAGVHQEYAARRGKGDAIYIATTRHRLGTPLLAEFYEEHSHASHHMVHRPVDPRIEALVLGARSLVLVDDEVSSGKTFINLYKALVSADLRHIETIYLVTLTDWSAGAASAAIGRDVFSVSLLSGRYHWQPVPGALPPQATQVEFRHRVGGSPDYRMDWGRLGVSSHASGWGGIDRLNSARVGERVLVVGTGEYVWWPFLYAEQLEQNGTHVRFSSVSRSPIRIGHAIESGIAFADNYGLGIANYLYNVDRAAYDRVFLCTETGRDTIDPVLLDHLNAQVICATAGPVRAAAAPKC